MHISQLSFIWGHAKPANYHFCTGEDLWSFFKVLSWSAVICNVEEQAWYYREQFINVSFLWTWLLGNVKQSHPTFLLSWKHFLELMFSQEFPFIFILAVLVTNTNTWYCVSLDGEVWSILTRHDLVRSYLVLPVTHGLQGCARPQLSVAFLSPLLPIMVIRAFTWQGFPSPAFVAVGSFNIPGYWLDLYCTHSSSLSPCLRKSDVWSLISHLPAARICWVRCDRPSHILCGIANVR